MSDKNKIVYKLGVCETAADVRNVLENVTSPELYGLKEFCREIVLNEKIRKVKSGVTYGTASAQNDSLIKKNWGFTSPTVSNDSRNSGLTLKQKGSPFFG